MALATTVARLLKIYGSDTISAADIQDFASEHAAQLREKALTRGLARKLLVLVRKEAGSALHADVFPALLGIISTLTENVASFRAFIDEALGKALVDVSEGREHAPPFGSAPHRASPAPVRRSCKLS